MNDDLVAVIGLGSARVMRCIRGDLPAAYEVWPGMRTRVSICPALSHDRPMTRSFALLAGCLLAMACSASTFPGDGTEAGRYVARSLDGHALPALTDSSAQEFGVLLADTLDLDGRGGVRRAFAIRRASTSFGTDEVYSVAIPMEYRLDGMRLELGSFTPCPANAICVANDVGVFTFTGIRLTTNRLAAGGTLVYERVRR
jgi:hypothetical protein